MDADCGGRKFKPRTNALDCDNLSNEGMQTHYKKKNSLKVARDVVLERICSCTSVILCHDWLCVTRLAGFIYRICIIDKKYVENRTKWVVSSVVKMSKGLHPNIV